MADDVTYEDVRQKPDILSVLGGAMDLYGKYKDIEFDQDVDEIRLQRLSEGIDQLPQRTVPPPSPTPEKDLMRGQLDMDLIIGGAVILMAVTVIVFAIRK